MANNRLPLKINDSSPFAVYTLYDVNRDVDMNMHNPETIPWMKLSKWNDNDNTIFTIMGSKENGGFDGKVRYSFLNPTTGQSLIENLEAGNYQGEIFLSLSTIAVTVLSVETDGIFTTDGDHNFATGDKIYLTDTDEHPDLSATEFAITVLSDTTFIIDLDPDTGLPLWVYPDTETTFASAVSAYDMTITQTTTHKAPIILKEDLA